MPKRKSQGISWCRLLGIMVLVFSLIIPPGSICAYAAQRFLAPPSPLAEPKKGLDPYEEEILESIREIRKNLGWEWDPELKKIREAAGKLRWKILGTPRLQKGDDWTTHLQADYHKLLQSYDAYLDGNDEQRGHRSAMGLLEDKPDKPKERVVYLSMEYALSKLLQIYSGGLGVLSGDHVRAASDRYPKGTFVFMSLAYQRGYFEQWLLEGKQEHRYTRVPWERYSTVVKDEATKRDLVIPIAMTGGKTIYVKVLKVMAGRAEGYMFTTDIPENEGPGSDPEFRRLTDNLYPQGRKVRFLQEYVLGVAGMELCKRLNIKAQGIHLNEGHSALSIMARVRQEIEEAAKRHGLTMAELGALRDENAQLYGRIVPNLDELRVELRKKFGFTSHTPVPAGNEIYDISWVREQGNALFGPGFEEVVAWLLPYGMTEESKSQFNFSSLAIAFSGFLNGVAKKNAEVSNKLYRNALANAMGKVFTWITNAVHRRFWQDDPTQTMLTASLQRLQANPATSTQFMRTTAADAKVPKLLHNLERQEMYKVVQDIPDEEFLSTDAQVKRDGIGELTEVTRRKRIIDEIERIRNDPRQPVPVADRQMERLRSHSLEELVKDPVVTALSKKKRLALQHIHGVQLDPEAFHVVIARRFAQYKRSDLALSIIPFILLQKYLEALGIFGKKLSKKNMLQSLAERKKALQTVIPHVVDIVQRNLPEEQKEAEIRGIVEELAPEQTVSVLNIVEEGRPVAETVGALEALAKGLGKIKIAQMTEVLQGLPDSQEEMLEALVANKDVPADVKSMLLMLIHEEIERTFDAQDLPLPVKHSLSRLYRPYYSTSGREEREKYNGLPEYMARFHILTDADEVLNAEDGWRKILDKEDPRLPGTDIGKYENLTQIIVNQSRWLADMLSGYETEKYGRWLHIPGLQEALKTPHLRDTLKVDKVQFVFAGKSHPGDEKGKGIIENILASKLEDNVAFVEDYDLEEAQALLKVADVWQNNPIPPKEASGTSGMKAGMKGKLNVSTRDGWVLEAPESTLFFTTLKQLFDLYAGIPGMEDRPAVEGAGQLHECLDPQAHPLEAYLFRSEEKNPECPVCRREAVIAKSKTVRGLISIFKDEGFRGVRAALKKATLAEVMFNFNMDRLAQEYEKMYSPAIHHIFRSPKMDKGARHEVQPHLPGLATRALQTHRDRVHMRSLVGERLTVIRGQAVQLPVAVNMGGLDMDRYVPYVYYGEVDRFGSHWRVSKNHRMQPSDRISPMGLPVFTGELPIPQDRAGKYEATVYLVPKDAVVDSDTTPQLLHPAWMNYNVHIEVRDPQDVPAESPSATAA